MKRSRSRRTGYTLLEIMLVMSVILIAASIAIVNVAGLPEAYRLSRVSNDLRGLLAGLRARAMDEGVAMEFSFVHEERTYRIRRAGTTASAANDNAAATTQNEISLDGADRIEFDSEAIFGDHELPGNLVLKRVSENRMNQAFKNPLSEDRETLRFLPNGSCTGLEFFLDDGVSTYHYQVRALTGGVKVRRLTYEERSALQ